MAMLDPARPFIDSVTVTIPYLHARTLAGVLMTAGHLVFAIHVLRMVRGRGPVRTDAPWAPVAPTAEVVK
jgi:cytochrome c oxidase cbb3-type subunit 1